MVIPKRIEIIIDLDNPADSKTELKQVLKRIKRIIRELARLSDQKSEAKK